MPSCPEERLLRQARQLDHDALGQVYELYSDAIYFYALRFLGETQAAEDCAADTLSRMLQALQNGGGPKDHLKAYLYRSAHNWIVDHYRRRPTLPLEEIEDGLRSADDPVDRAEKEIDLDRIRRALRRLTPEQQQVVVLRFVEGWEIDEIAHCLRKPVGAVKALQHRALAALRRLLNTPEGSEG